MPKFDGAFSRISLRLILLGLIRPILRFHLGAYERIMRRFPFPEPMDRQVAGPNALRILFVGDIAVAGYGVLLEGMALPAQTANIFAARHAVGCAWDQISQFDLTAQQATSRIDDRAVGADVVVIALGIPDVLLVTDQDTWLESLTQMVSAVRSRAGERCHVMFAGIPPMGEFQPIPPVARRLIARQVKALNDTTRQLSDQLDNSTFVAFPDWGVKRMYIQDVFSYRTMHHMWAQTIASHLGVACDKTSILAGFLGQEDTNPVQSEVGSR